jgi:hypothetical protein
MSLIFHDGFDEYSTYADMESIGGWATYNNPTIVDTFRAVGSKCLRLEGVGSTSSARIFFPNQVGNTVFFGFAYKLEGNGDFDSYAFHFGGGGIESANYQIYIKWDSGSGNRRFTAYTAEANTLVAQGAIGSVDPAIEHLIQFKVKIAATGGIIEMLIDGTTHFSYTGDVQNSANTALEWVYFAYPAGVRSNYIDDLWICNDQGTINNTYLGNRFSKIIHPTSDDVKQLSVNIGANNFAAIDDLVGSPDGDNTYIFGAIPGDKDTFGLNTITSLGIISGVRLITNARKDSSDARSVKAGIKIGTNEQQVTHTLSETYQAFIDYFETSDGTNRITQSNIDAIQTTVEVV